MLQSFLTISVVILGTLYFCTVSVQAAPADAKTPFSDVWSQEFQESYKTCKGRLPPSLQDEDMIRFAVLPVMYAKYWDQITLFRLLNTQLVGHEKQPMEELRCLYESPCIHTTNDIKNLDPGSSFYMNYTACTGTIVSRATVTKEKQLDMTFFNSDGTVAFNTLFVHAYTDKMSFVIFISCMHDGSQGFHVYTTGPGLSAHSRHLIKEYLENAGFKDSFRISTSYSSSTCKSPV